MRTPCASDAINSFIPPIRNRSCWPERPNQLWSWDITKLLGPAKWTYYLYVILDVFSRYVVGWTVQYRESAHLSEQLMAQALTQNGIVRDQLTIHADRRERHDLQVRGLPAGRPGRDLDALAPVHLDR
jgi:transposase InsO family protein